MFLKNNYKLLLQLINEIPTKGFASSDLSTKSRSCRRVKLLFNSTIEHLSAAMFYENGNIANDFIAATADNVFCHMNYQSSLLVYSYLLSASLSNANFKSLIDSIINYHASSKRNFVINPNHKTFGRIKFISLRHSLARLIASMPVSK